MKVLGLLQNAWFKPDTPREVAMAYARDDDVRRRILARSKTGNKLIRLMGQDVFNHIVWNNTTAEWASEARGRRAIDMEHVVAVIDQVWPDVIIAFGNQARDAVVATSYAGDVILCKHPNARFTADEEFHKSLDPIVGKIRQWILTRRE